MPSTLHEGVYSPRPSAPPFPVEETTWAGPSAAQQSSRLRGQSARPRPHVSPPYSGMSGASAEDMPLVSHAYVPSTHDHTDHAPVTSPAALTSSCSSLSLPSPSHRRYDTYLTSSAEDAHAINGIYGHHPASPSCPPTQHIGSVLGQRHLPPTQPPSATEFVNRQRSVAGESPMHRKPSRANQASSPGCTLSPGSPSPTKLLPGEHDHRHNDATLAASPGRRHFGRASGQLPDAALRQPGRPRPLQTSQELNRVADAHLKMVPEDNPPQGHAAPPSPLGLRNPASSTAGFSAGRENSEPRAGSRPVSTPLHGMSPDVASPSSPFGRITSPLEESAALLRSMRRAR